MPDHFGECKKILEPSQKKVDSRPAGLYGAAMRLDQYLTQEGLTVRELAASISPVVGRRIVAGTLRAISYGGGCRTDVARAIILVTEGAVTLDDLVPARPAKRMAARKKKRA